MSKSTKSEKSFQEKLKSFFKGKPTLPDPKELNFVLTSEIVSDLGSDNAENVRVKAMRDLTPIVRQRRLQDHSVELLWVKLSDLVCSPVEETRHDTMTFFESLIRGQYVQLGIMRAEFFRLIKNWMTEVQAIVKKDADLIQRIALLDALTEGGRDILHFEDEMGGLLVQLFPAVLMLEDNGKLYADFMAIILNVIKFNSAYLDQEVVCKLVSYLSHVCVKTNLPENVSLCLQCLDAIICYSFIPKEGLVTFISTLCLVVNMESQCLEAWRITKNLMGTHIGHSALYTLCQMIQTTENHTNVALVRGAVFFIGMSLWGPQPVKSLTNYSATTIVPTFVNALGCMHHLVIYEVILQTEHLATKLSSKLTATASDCVLSLVELLLEEIPVHVEKSLRQEVFAHVHNIITSFENLSAQKKYLGSKHKLYKVIDRCAKHRPENSVIGLISYRANLIYPTKRAWIRMLCDLLEKYFKNEIRTSIRIKALGVLFDTYKSNRHIYEEELMEKVVLPFLGSIDVESSEVVRLEAVRGLTSICADSLSRKCFVILKTLQRITKRPLEAAKPGQEVSGNFEDIRSVVEGLIDVFTCRLCQHPSSFVVEIYNILVQHLEDHYENPEIFGKHGSIREQIFRLFMRLRANDSYHLGIQTTPEEDIRFSPYIICQEPSRDDHRKPPAAASVSHGASANNDRVKMISNISLTHACLMVIRCLSKEDDWAVLRLVLVQVPAVLQNKAILSRYGSSIRAFVTPLIEMINTTSKYDGLYNTDDEYEKRKLTRSEFHNQVFPVLAAMAPYHEYLDKGTSQLLIKALQSGLLSRDCNRICIVALTACVLEMKHSTSTLIPQILLNFSKISPTKQIATPMLEFLSTLIRLPDTFSKFFPTNFMSVFAIALNFTNPFRFDPYTVALAHHIVVMWFLKCRLADRQNFVYFIIRSLNHNLLRTYEDGEFRKTATSTSSNSGKQLSSAASSAASVVEKVRERSGSILRPRSSSFGNNADKKETPPAASSPQPTVEEESFNKMMAFHQELSETCQDLLARFMFADVSVQQRRLPTAHFLLKEGQSASWVIGAMIITITTSRCDHISSREGLCDRCYMACTGSPVSAGRPTSTGVTSVSPDPVDSGSRRRHQSDFPKSSSRTIDVAEVQDLRAQLTAEKSRSDSTNVDKVTDGDLSQLEILLRNQREKEKAKPEMCACWCTGWAEILVRRPSGDVSWMCRVQNGSLSSNSLSEFPLADLTAIFQPSMEPDNLLKDPPIDVNKIGEEEYASFLNNQSQTGTFSGTPDQAKQTALAESPEGNEDEPNKENQADDDEKKSRKGCGPIMEDDEGEESRYDLTKRRPSLQTSVTQPQRSLLPANPPRTPDHEKIFGHQPLQQQQSVVEKQVAAPIYRDRAHTVSGAALVRSLNLFSQRRGSTSTTSSGSPTDQPANKTEKATGISPQFVLLTLYRTFYPQGSVPPTEEPILLPATRMVEASIRNIDRIHAHETHKIGVLYVGPSQAKNECAILRNQFGSLRYTDFLHGLGRLISLRDVDKAATFLGGLDASDGDGDFAYMWEDDVMQVIFHVATLMPTNLEKDPQCNKKKRHIGNDFVAIVYNDDRETYQLGTVKGQFIYAAVVITPLDQGSNRVEIRCRPELHEPLGHVKDPRIVSDRNLAIVVRQMSLHCNLASIIQKSLQSGREPYASNWLERLRAIKRLREKVLKEQLPGNDDSKTQIPNDFTKYVLRNPENK